MVVPKLVDTSPLETEAKYRINQQNIKGTSNAPESWQFYAYMPLLSTRTLSYINNHNQCNEWLACILSAEPD